MKSLYLQFGKTGEPMQTIAVESKECPTRWQDKGLSYTASGYGSKIPTRWKIKYNGLWRRVYCRIYSNVGTCYVVINGESVIVSEG